MPKPNLTARMTFRLPEAVAESWRESAQAAGLSVSDFVRVAVDAHQVTGISGPIKRPKRRAYTPADPELLRHLAMIGNNINQIARRVNAKTGGIDAVELLLELRDIEKRLSFPLPQQAQRAAMKEENNAL